MVSSFSDELKSWLESDQPKTLRGLIEVFSQKSFAALFLILMILPALPAPTGGVTHVTEIITLLLAVELVAGRDTVWLPRRFLNFSVKGLAKPAVSRKMIAFIKRLERLPRLNWHLGRRSARLIGSLVFVFTAAAFLAPPFSGLDTLPAMGVVLLALAMIVESGLLLILGGIAGVAGIALIMLLGAAVWRLF